MAFTTSALTNFFNLLYNATAWTSIAQNSGSPATIFYLSLHNSDPGISGSQSTSETAYTNYVRFPLNRNSGGMTVGSSPITNMTNTGSISFNQCTGGSDILTHIGIGLSVSGAGTLLQAIPVGPGPQLEFTCTQASPGVIQTFGAALAVNSRVSVYATQTNQLASGLTQGTVYYVGQSLGSGTYSLSTTPGNANPVNTAGSGGGVLVVQATLSVSNGVTPTFPAGSIVFTGA